MFSKITIATWITLSRIMLTPLIVLSLINQSWPVAGILFSVAALSDMLDGFFARIFNEQTVLGASLDPIADKILLLASLTTLACLPTGRLHIPWWFVACIAIRELIVIAGTGFLYYFRGITYVKPTMMSKLTTVAQSLLVVWLCVCYFFHFVPIVTYHVSLFCVLTLVCVSLVQYIGIGIRLLQGKSVV